MKGIQGKILKPVLVMVLLFVMCTLLQLSSTSRIHNYVSRMNDQHYTTILKTDELKLSVVQVQQWLTDISATRGAAGYDDGLDEAAAYADHVRTLVEELRQIGTIDDASLDAVLTSFDAYYETGVRMAHAYIDGGPQAGNVIMEEFDTVATDINDKIDVLAQTSEERVANTLTSVYNAMIQNIAFTCCVVMFTVAMFLYVRRRIAHQVVQPLQEIETAAKQMAKGSLHVDIAYQSNDEMGVLSDSIRTLSDGLRDIVTDIGQVLAGLAAGDFHVKSNGLEKYIGDFAPILASMRLIRDNLNETLMQIDQSADQVASGSTQVSSSAQALSQGTAEQASAIEELAATVEEISDNIHRTAENAAQASQKADETGAQMQTSNTRMQELMTAMDEIGNASNEISKIIKTIEDIAFQTNILALNAAVEAARAGTAGKGFAVVADEVRNLAGKSAEASKNTAAMIEHAIQAVQNGTSLADETAQALIEAVDNVQQVIAGIGDISLASAQQATAVAQVTQGIDQISGVVQTNSATAEESAAASDELSGQALLLKNQTGKFRLLETK